MKISSVWYGVTEKGVTRTGEGGRWHGLALRQGGIEIRAFSSSRMGSWQPRFGGLVLPEVSSGRLRVPGCSPF